MDVLVSILNFINEVYTSPYFDIVLQLVVASGIISVVLQVIKKWRIYRNAESLFKNDLFVFIILTTLSFVTAAIHYVSTTPTSSPKILAVQTALLVFTSSPIYLTLVKPLWYRLVVAMQKRVDQAAELNREKELAKLLPKPEDVFKVKSPAPVTPPPAPEPVRPIDDFSR